MTKGNNSKPGFSKPTGQVIFADITLVEADKQRLAKDEDFRERFWTEVNAIVARGYRVVLKPDDRNGGTIATAQAIAEDADDGDVVYVVRSRFGGKALAQLVFAYSVVGDGDFPYNGGDSADDEEETAW